MGTSTLDYPSTVVIENVRGGSLSDLIRGNAANNQLFGNAGYDSLYGALGNDVLNSGGADNSGDNLYGGDDHIYAVDGKQNEIYCGGTTDTDTVEADPLDVIAKLEGKRLLARRSTTAPRNSGVAHERPRLSA